MVNPFIPLGCLLSNISGDGVPSMWEHSSSYIHTLDTALIMAADTISGYIQGFLDGVESSSKLIRVGPRLTQGRAGPFPQEYS
jgi:hypothetical protein